jgi:TolA-binding protein
MENNARSGFALAVSLAEVMLLLVFAAMMVSVTDSVEGRAPDPQHSGDESTNLHAGPQDGLNTPTEKNKDLEKQLSEMTLLMNELTFMVGAKGATKEGFQEAVENLKRGYALCQKQSNTLIEVSVLNGLETVHVIGDIPSNLIVHLAKGDQTSDLEQIVSFLQDVYQYEKDQSCRFNYRLKYATDNDYRKAREGFEKYFYPEKMIRTG